MIYSKNLTQDHSQSSRVQSFGEESLQFNSYLTEKIEKDLFQTPNPESRIGSNVGNVLITDRFKIEPDDEPQRFTKNSIGNIGNLSPSRRTKNRVFLSREKGTSSTTSLAKIRIVG